MKRVIFLALFITLLLPAFAEIPQEEPQQGFWSGFLQRFNIFSSSTFNNNKLTTEDPSPSTVAYEIEEDDTTMNKNDENLDENHLNEQIESGSSEQHIFVQTSGQIFENDDSEKRFLKKTDKAEKGKFSIFRNSKTFSDDAQVPILVQQDQAATEGQKTETPIDDTDTAKSINDMKNQISSDVHNATEAMKEEMRQNNEILKGKLDNATLQMQDEVKNSETRIVDSVRNESQKIKHEVKKATEEIKDEVAKVGDKVDENLIQTLKLRIITLEDQLEGKEAELDKTKEEINKLKSELPPPETVCDTLYDCASCTANSQCGWCIAEQKCTQGDKIGPLHASCNFWDYGMCSGAGCARYKDCNSCLQDPLCGFCGENEKCIEQPADFQGCKMDEWFHSQGQKPLCPLPQPLTADPLAEAAAEHKKEEEQPDVEKKLIKEVKTYTKQERLFKLEQEAKGKQVQIDELKHDINDLKVKLQDSETKYEARQKELESERQAELERVATQPVETQPTIVEHGEDTEFGEDSLVADNGEEEETESPDEETEENNEDIGEESIENNEATSEVAEELENIENLEENIEDNGETTETVEEATGTDEEVENVENIEENVEDNENVEDEEDEENDAATEVENIEDIENNEESVENNEDVEAGETETA